jgi:lipopolysaccharide transport system permease protein
MFVLSSLFSGMFNLMGFKPSHTLQRNFDLLYLLTYKEMALKYKRTILGIFWSLLNPLLLCLVFVVAFKVFMRFEVENYTFFLLSALFPWTWFSSSVLLSSRCLIDNVTLVKKIIFPRYYLVTAVIITQLVNLVFSIPILLFLSLTSSHGPSLKWLIGLPLLIVIQGLFTFGITLIVSILNTYFRDTEYLAGVIMTLFFWMTPITYPLDAIPPVLQRYFLFNPLTSIMFSWRELFFNNVLLWDKILIAMMMAFLAFMVGVIVFRKMEKNLDQVL